MKKKVIRVGANSSGIILPAQVLKLLDLKEGQTVKVSLKDSQIVIDRRATDDDVVPDKRQKKAA